MADCHRITWGPYFYERNQVEMPAGSVIFNGSEHFVPEQVLQSLIANGASDAVLEAITTEEYADEMLRKFNAGEPLTRLQRMNAAALISRTSA